MTKNVSLFKWLSLIVLVTMLLAACTPANPAATAAPTLPPAAPTANNTQIAVPPTEPTAAQKPADVSTELPAPAEMIMATTTSTQDSGAAGISPA